MQEKETQYQDQQMNQQDSSNQIHHQVGESLGMSDSFRNLKNNNSNININQNMNDVKVVPHIKTFESDIYNAVKEGEMDKINVLSGQLDIQDTVNMQDRKHKVFIVLMCSLVFSFISGCAFAGYYIYKEKNKPLPVETVHVQKYYISDIFPFVKNVDYLKSYTGEATSSKNIFDENFSYIIEIIDFDSLYKTITLNEEIVKDISKEIYKYNLVSDFKDVTIQNIDMRMADGVDGAVIYGFSKKNKIIISNNINEYLKLYASL
jgi:hypothetical protein